jgi:hypothetical protein
MRKCCCKYLQQNLQERIRKREREEWERFGQHKLALRIDGEMRRGRHSFILGREERPLLDELQVTFIKGKRTKSRRAHF